MEKNSKIYRVRNHLHQIVGEYTDKQLLKRIRAGKYTGDEEVSLLPHGEWQRLSSIPEFYDILLKRIIGEPEAVSEIHPNEEQPELSRKATHAPEVVTRQENAKTEHLDPNLFSNPSPVDIPEAKVGETIHQSDIDKLFELSKGGQEHSANPLAKTFVNQAPTETPPVLKQPLDYANPRALFAKYKQGGDKRRVVILASVLVIFLVLLFKTGEGEEGSTDHPLQLVSSQSESAPISEEERKETLQVLLEEAQTFISYDTPPFYLGATELMKEALGYESNNLEALSILSLAGARYYGEAAEKEKVKSEVLSAIARGREIEPHRSSFYRAEAILYLEQGEFDKALEKVQAASEADPTNFENFLVFGEISFQKGDYQAAKNLFNQAKGYNPNSVRAHYYLSKTLEVLNDDELAKNEAGEAARINPLHAASYTVVGDILSKRKQLREARIFYDLTTKLGKFGTKASLGQAHYRLGTLDELLGKPELAEREYRLAYHFVGNSNRELISKIGKSSISEKEVREMLSEVQHDKSYYQDRGRELIKENKPQEAIRFLQAVRLLAPEDGAATVKVGEVMEKIATTYEDFRKIMLVYQRAIKKDPTNAKAYVRLAMLETEQYNFDRSLKLLSKAIEVAGDDAEVYVALGKHFYKRQDYVNARDYFSKAATINPTDSEIYYYYGLLTRLYKKDLVREATRLFNQAYTLDPQNYDALAEWLKLKAQNYEKNFAVKFIRNLIEREPSVAELYWVYGEIYAINGEFRRAIGFYHKALDRDNKLSKVRMSLGRALVAVGELPAAVEEYRLASRLDRRNGEGFHEAASLLIEMKRLDQAEQVLKQLYQTTPNFPGVHRLLSKVYQSQNKRELAVESMKKEVENNPVNYKFTLEFAELLMGYEKYDDAIKELQKVTSLPSETKSPEFKVERIQAFLFLARCLRAQNKADYAEGAIRTALSIDPNDPELHRELGYVYHLLQRDREATDAFNFYLSRNPAAQDAALIKSLIQKMGTEE